MTTTTIGQLLGRLDLEASAPAFDPQREPWPRTAYRPAGIYLQNDGRFEHWLDPWESEEYTVRRDEYGWVVANLRWPSGHVYRLAHAGSPANGLPLAESGMVPLVDGREYAIRSVLGGGATFDLYEV